MVHGGWVLKVAFWFGWTHAKRGIKAHRQIGGFDAILSRAQFGRLTAATACTAVQCG